MRQRLLPLLPLIALLLLAINHPVQAEPACGSDTSTDPDVARGKDVWLNGYCKGFLPCRLVLEQFHACQAAEGFLARLDAKEGVPLTESQVEDALLRTTGSATGMSACLWSFDAEGCKRYLGLGGGRQDAEVAAKGGSAVDAPAARKPMSNTAAVLARQRIRDMDANAHTGLGVIERACKAGAEECRATLEQMVDPVVREADELNANSEYLAQLPVYTPGSLEYAGRLGWTKQDGRWVFGGGGPAANTGTLGSYLLSVDECRKLHERLTQAVRSEPGKEPTELSFFEAECLPQLPALAADIGQWRQGFGAAGPAVAVAEAASTEAVAAVSEAAPAGAGSEVLDQWNVAMLGEGSPEAEYDPADSIGKTEFAGGCYMYEYLSEPDDDLISLTWSGRCEPGKPVNGRGRVEWVSSNLDSRRDASKEHNRYSQEGTMANGRWRGSVKWAAYIPWNPPDSQHQGGTGQFDELGCARDESDPEDSSGYYAGCRESYSAFDTKQGR